MDLLDGFRTPPSYYGSAPFWSWNDDLRDDELVRQIRAMKDGGMGGFFMHSRVGLVTPYLSQEWMDRVRTCVEEARRLDMKAWLYDEDRYPSGPAGGIVPNRSKEYRNKALRMERMPAAELEPRDHCLRIVAVRKGGERPTALEDVTSQPADAIRSLGKDLLVFTMVYAVDSPRMNNSCYIDTRNPDAVDAFLESTHEAYRKEFGSDFGGVIPGIFTDEPQGGTNGCPGPSVPWTNAFPEHFREQKGYDILDRLPELFLDIGEFRKTRFDYWDEMTRLFNRIFCKRIYDWCEENKLELTGHFWEHTFPLPIHTGSTMPHYEYQQIPGIDMLFNQYELRRPPGGMMQFGNIMIVKEVAGVAHQLGRPRVMSETYAGSGWDFTFADQKRIGDWEYVLGINFLCQHLSMYSMRGCRKHDYPPSFLHQSPWWTCYSTLGNYYARLSYLLSQGRFVADVLLLHPSSSTWIEYSPLKQSDEAERLTAAFLRLNKDLCELHRDFDLGDDILIERHGRVQGNRFVLGEMSYRVVLVPTCSVLRATTLRLLRDFVEAGGHVIAVEPTPTLLDGSPSDKPASFFSDERVTVIPDEREEVRVALDAAVPPDVTVTDSDGRDIGPIYYQHRRHDDGHIYFFANVDNEHEYEATISMPGEGVLEEWNPLTGETKQLTASWKDGRYALSLSFAPIESRLLVVSPEASAASPPAEPPDPETQRVEIHDIDEPSIRRTELNALTLDYCRYQIEDGPWSDRVYVLEADRHVHRHYGLPENPHQDAQPWLAGQSAKPLGDGAVVRIRHEFESEFRPEDGRKVFFVTELADRLAISVNGRTLERGDGEGWIDRSFGKIDITEAVQAGRNEIVLEAAPYGHDMEIHACYLAGDFQVVKHEDRFVLVPESDTLPEGDWSQCGYPFYPGSFVYAGQVHLTNLAEDERVLVRVEDWAGVALTVSVNGHPAGTIGWKPYELDVRAWAKEGENEIAVEVVGSLRNLLGPHHLVNPTPGFIHPGSFYAPDNWKDDYDLVPSGLMGPIKVVRLK